MAPSPGRRRNHSLARHVYHHRVLHRRPRSMDTPADPARLHGQRGDMHRLRGRGCARHADRHAPRGAADGGGNGGGYDSHCCCVVAASRGRRGMVGWAVAHREQQADGGLCVECGGEVCDGGCGDGVGQLCAAFGGAHVCCGVAAVGFIMKTTEGPFVLGP